MARAGTDGRGDAQRRRARDARTLGATTKERAGTGLALSHRARSAPGVLTNGEVAEQLGVHPATVGKWRRRFAANAPGWPARRAPARRARDRSPMTMSERVIVKTLEETPTDATHWSTRSMAKATGMSQSAVSRIWRAFGLKPHLRRDLQAVARPAVHREGAGRRRGSTSTRPRRALVLCVDEKTQVQALDRTAPVLPLRPGLPERRTHDYVRNGTTNLYAALDVASGKVIADMTERHRAVEFRRFLNLINRCVPEDLDVHVIVDNVSTHKTPEIHRWLLRHPRFHLHFTPTYSSWMNLVERWFAELTNKWLRRGTHRSTKELEGGDHGLDRPMERGSQALRLAQERRRDPRHPRRICQRISDSGH